MQASISWLAPSDLDKPERPEKPSKIAARTASDGRDLGSLVPVGGPDDQKAEANARKSPDILKRLTLRKRQISPPMQIDGRTRQGGRTGDMACGNSPSKGPILNGFTCSSPDGLINFGLSDRFLTKYYREQTFVLIRTGNLGGLQRKISTAGDRNEYGGVTNSCLYMLVSYIPLKSISIWQLATLFSTVVST